MVEDRNILQKVKFLSLLCVFIRSSIKKKKFFINTRILIIIRNKNPAYAKSFAPNLKEARRGIYPLKNKLNTLSKGLRERTFSFKYFPMYIYILYGRSFSNR